jgi:hypothetical protein
MSEEINAENRNARIAIPATRCCSFCGIAGHNISRCNDPQLFEFEELCVYTQTYLGFTRFRNWLIDYSRNNPNIVTTYAVRFCGCTLRDFMITCVNQVELRIRNLIEQPAEPELPQNNDNQRLYNLIERTIIRSQPRVNLNTQFIYEAIIFIEMIIRMREQIGHNGRFNIKTTIVKCSQTEQCDCNICYDAKEKEKFVKLNCGHEFCKDCIKKTLQNAGEENPKCALCRAEIKNMELSSETICDEFNELIVQTEQV